jgi:hypothetical protein
MCRVYRCTIVVPVDDEWDTLHLAFLLCHSTDFTLDVDRSSNMILSSLYAALSIVECGLHGGGGVAVALGEAVTPRRDMAVLSLSSFQWHKEAVCSVRFGIVNMSRA